MSRNTHGGKPAEFALADWLEELSVFGTPRRLYDAETAEALSQAIRHWYLVRLAIEPRALQTCCRTDLRQRCHPAKLGAL